MQELNIKLPDFSENIELEDTTQRAVVNIKNDSNILEGVEIIRPSEVEVESLPDPRPSEPEVPDLPRIIKNTPTKTPLPGISDPFEDSRPPPTTTSSYSHDFSSFMNPIKKKEQPPEENKFYSSDNDTRSRSSSIPMSPRSYSSSIDSYGGGRGSSLPGDDYTNVNQQERKQDLLIRLQQLEKHGVILSKNFNMKTSFEEIQFEYNKQKKLLEQEESVKFMRNALITTVHGIEILNNKFDPVGAKLNGWSNSIVEDIGSYEGIFERLSEKYKGSVQMAPEFELLLALGQSAFMFHLMESIFKGALPNLGESIRQDPNLVRGLASATARAADMNNNFTPGIPAPRNQTMSGPSFNIGEILGNLGGLMGGGGGGGGLSGMGSSPQTHSPSVIPPGTGAFRESFNNPPPTPVNTRNYKEDNDDDRFSIASSGSEGSHIQSPTIEHGKGKHKGKRTINI